MISIVHVFIHNQQVKITRTLFSCFIAFAIIGTASLSAQTPIAGATTIPEVTIAGTQLLHLPSAITGKDYNLYVNLPGGYKDSTKKFPVLYLLDAQWDFPLVQAIYGEQYYDGFIPEMIIVGITWGGENPNYDKLRAHDFTPTDVRKDGSYGNAPNFLSFISKELIPYIESNYRVRPDDRTLVGSSFGGLFSLYALFQEPAVFNRFIFTSPALQWDNYLVKSINNDFATKHNGLSAKVYTAIGELENVEEFQKLVDAIREKNYQNLELQSFVVKGMGHSGAKAESYARGFQYVFKKPEVKVDPAILAGYAGDYGISGYKIKVMVEEGRLIVATPDNGNVKLESSGPEDFYVPGQFLNIHFVKDPAGKVTGFNVQQYSGNTFFNRENQ